MRCAPRADDRHACGTLTGVGYRTIVIGTDGSATAYRAQQKAVRFARKVGARLLITCATGPSGISQDDAIQILAKAAGSAERHGVPAETELREGEPGEMLADAAREARADLIAVGDVGMGKARRLRLGGVAERAAHRAPCDVLIVRTRRKVKKTVDPRVYRTIIVGTDGSPTASEAVRKAFDLGMMLEIHVTVVYVAGDELVGSIVLERAGTGKPDWVPFSTRLVHGKPADKLIATAAEEDGDLMIVGNKGMTGTRRYLMSSVPLELAHRAPRDVLIAKTVDRTLEDLAPGHGGVVSVGVQKLAVFVDADGTIHSLSPRCTHMGCTVDWNDADKTWDCPCHGSRYRFDGTVVRGPAAAGLAPTPHAPARN
jgi:nucleotide-binding universal stress UspA family protein/nitrite reductase/ring-hydroxylating ferredoxin subunit